MKRTHPQQPTMFSPNELDSSSPQMEQPSGIKTVLKPHQLTVLHAARNLEETRLTKVVRPNYSYDIKSSIGVLCDKVGSGKTLELLSIIESKRSLTEYDPHKSLNISDEITVSYTSNKSKIFKPVNLIVVPHTIFKQWVEAIKTQTNLTLVEIYNKKTIEKFVKEPEFSLNQDVILVSSTQYRKFYDAYETYERAFSQLNNTTLILSRVVFDEANMINIKSLSIPKVSFSWFLTSSCASLYYPFGKQFYRSEITGDFEPWDRYTDLVRYPAPSLKITGIENTGYIRDTFARLSTHTRSTTATYNYNYNNVHSYIEDYVNKMFIKNKNSFIEESFKLEQPNVTDFILENPIIYNMLTNIVDSKIISMINGGDINSAIESLNCNKTTDDNLITTVTKTLETQLHNLNVERNMKENIIYTSDEYKATVLEKINDKIKDVQHKIKVLTERINENDMCAICYDTITNHQTIVDCCHNSFCFACLTTWMTQSNKCPHCRKKIGSTNLTVVTETIEEKEVEKEEPRLTKIEKLKQLLLERIEEKPDTKFLIFSEYSNIFMEISRLLVDMDINYRIVKGQVNKTIRDYKEGDLNCLLLNTTHFGNGLNLENTDDIILLHSLNKEMNHQVIGRAQRPGRKTKLNIWNLKYKNEV